MKGVVIERARPSNTIDVYPLIKEAAKEGAYPVPVSKKQVEDFYYRMFTQELPNEGHFYYLARRSKGFLGLLHAVIVPSRWDGSGTTMWIDLVYVRDHRRKCGIGKMMIDRLMEDAEKLGIKNFEFLCPDDQVEMWTKKRGAKSASVFMRLTL
jgi:GNAT superfamily N-acetyltransferase